MHLRPILIGIVEIDPMAGETFAFESRPMRGFGGDGWRNECTDNTPYAIFAADLPRLREDLEFEFQRLQARLVA